MSNPIDLMGLVRAKELKEDLDFDKEVESKFHIVYGETLAKPLPPKPWLCRDLRIAPGAPVIFGGAGYSGKTMAAQALALSVATGRKLWGQFEVRQGPVLHYDWEQNELTIRRYQRMARSMGVDLNDLSGMLGTSIIPNGSLDDERGIGWNERALASMCKGKALCIIDSLRQAFERVDENSSSSIAIVMKMLGRVSKATGCVMLLIAHSRKPTDDSAATRHSLRGSGAVFDQADTVFMLSGTKGKPVYVENHKERHTGKDIPKFGLRFSNEQGPNMGDDPYVIGDIDPEWGLIVEHLSEPEMQCEYDRSDTVDNNVAINVQRITSIGDRLMDLLSRAPEGLTIATLRGLLKGSASPADISASIPVLIQSGALYVEGSGVGATYIATQRSREPGEEG